MLIRRRCEARGVEAKEKACPLLVPLVEEGWAEHTVTEQVARIYLDEVSLNGFESADVLVLGCTHYPLLKSSAAPPGSGPRHHRGFRRLHCPGRQPFAASRLAEDLPRKKSDVESLA